MAIGRIWFGWQGMLGAVVGAVCFGVLAIAVSVALTAGPAASDRIGPDGNEIVDVRYGAKIEEWVVVAAMLAGGVVGGWIGTRLGRSVLDQAGQSLER